MKTRPNGRLPLSGGAEALRRRAPRLLRQAGLFFAPPFGGFCARPAHTVEG